MKKSVQQEVKKLIIDLQLKCTIKQFKDQVYWGGISKYQKLSEEFIREFSDKVNWYSISYSQKFSEEFIREFSDKVDWYWISRYQKLSEEFIREFSDKVDWNKISCYQKLSEEFIREFKDKVNWDGISCSQKLSEEFIREFSDKVYWYSISYSQKLSEEFIREFSNKVYWYGISCYQKLSEAFIEEFKNKINIDEQLKSHHVKKTLEQKRKEVQEYAAKYNLKYDNEYLYAYRDHDKWGRGVWNKTISYQSGIYYQDWHCDLNPDNEDSFGLGIWPEGNTPVKIKIQDWGTIVNHDANGKARVCGFQII
jgi:hypothetical protein